MVANWYDRLTLSSRLRPEAEGVEARYRLMLRNDGDEVVRDFRLGFSGPGYVSPGSEVVGASVVARLSTFCELAPPRDFALQPGKTWTVDIFKQDFPLRHWTDGATTGFLVLADGSVRSLRTVPVVLEGSDKPQLKGTAIYEVPEHPPVPVSIVPWPKRVDVSGRRTAPSGLAPIANGAFGKAAAAAFAKLTERLFPGEGLARPAHEGGYPVELVAGPGGKEGYAIDFARERASITAETEAGALYGLITLGQILRGARLHLRQFSFPTEGRIEDAPVMGWRGSHIDVARRVYARDEIEQFVAILAWNKLNVLHWHLSDDEAWRVEIDAYPQLTGKGAWRGYGMPIPPVLGSGPERTGGYYTKADVRAVVALATEFGVDVVPEIDVPGHCYALIEAIPALRDAGENAPYYSIQSFPKNCLNPALDTTYEVIETVFSELVELFPSRYFHVGADEVPEDAWHASPAANKLRKELGVTGAASLQARFLQRVQAFLTSRGKVTGAWEEASHGGGIDRANAYLVGWRDMDVSQKLAAEGYDVVVAPAQAYYLDMALSEDFHECGAAWAGWSSLENTYAFEPAGGWDETERQHLLGIQACIWSEPMTDRAVFDRLVFPRLSAIAETGWSEHRDWERFKALVGLMPNLYGRYETF